MDFLQLNKLADLHNGRQVIFCKTDYLDAELKKIKKLKHQVVLVSGNGDVGIDARFVSNLPDNVLMWYCQNNLFYHDRLRAIPIGLENTVECKRRGHGMAWPHAVEKLELLTKAYNNRNKRSPSKLLYANFNIQTNKQRIPIMNICKQSSFITWDEPKLSYSEFITRVIDHEAVICPAGNGVDTHRLYEILYCGVIPVTIKTGDYALYTQLYNNLPIVVLNHINELQNEDKLKELIAAAKQKQANIQLLDCAYWLQKITDAANNIVMPTPGLLNKLLNYIGH